LKWFSNPEGLPLLLAGFDALLPQPDFTHHSIKELMANVSLLSRDSLQQLELLKGWLFFSRLYCMDDSEDVEDDASVIAEDRRNCEWDTFRMGKFAIPLSAYLLEPPGHMDPAGPSVEEIVSWITYDAHIADRIKRVHAPQGNRRDAINLAGVLLKLHKELLDREECSRGEFKGLTNVDCKWS